MTKSYSDDKPATPAEAFGHHGVKGQRWGVRKKDKISGRTTSSGDKPTEESHDTLSKAMDAVHAKEDPKKVEADAKRKLKAQAEQSFPTKRAAKAEKVDKQAAQVGRQVAALKRRQDKLGTGFVAGFQRRDLQSQINQGEAMQKALLKKSGQLKAGKLTDAQKLAIGVGAGAALAGLALYGQRQLQLREAGVTPGLKKRLLEDNKAQSTAQWKQMFGNDPGFKPALSHFDTSGGGFYQGLSSKKALSRPEFVIPKDTVFQRLSNHEEDSTQYGKMKGAYATFLHNDKKLYGASSEFGGSKFTVNFQPKEDVKVPSLPTVLAHLKQVHNQENPKTPFSDEQIYTKYKSMAGDSWADTTSLKLFDSLRSFGYSAIVDDMDAGYLGDLPVVFFGNAHPATSTPRTKIDQVQDSVGVLHQTRQHA